MLVGACTARILDCSLTCTVVGRLDTLMVGWGLPPGSQNGLVDVDAFVRDGYVVIRGAFDADIATECRALIWDSMAG
jgi:hypothetical protein